MLSSGLFVGKLIIKRTKALERSSTPSLCLQGELNLGCLDITHSMMKKALKHFREENFSPNVYSLENWIRHAFIEKEILFHSTNAYSVKHLIEALGYHFILPGEKFLINSPCKIDGCFRNLPILGFYTNHGERIELTEVKHVFSNHTE